MIEAVRLVEHAVLELRKAFLVQCARRISKGPQPAVEWSPVIALGEHSWRAIRRDCMRPSAPPALDHHLHWLLGPKQLHVEIC